jgi:hypothetical protein
MALFLEDFSFIEKYDTIEESENGEKKYFLRGVFSRVNKPNRNNRIYTEEVMRESIDSIRETISNRGLVGSLDHPCFCSNDFDVLCEVGWKPFQNIKVGEKIATFNEDNVIEYQPVQTIIDKPYKGKVYHFKNRNIDTKVTGAHRFYLEDRYGKRQIVTAEEIYNNRTKYGHSKIIKIDSPGIYLTEDSMSIEEEDYEGNIYCLTVENGNFYVKQNNKAFLTGNSSPKISVRDISHVITDLRIAPDGAVLGEAEALDTNPGLHLKKLMEAKIRLGVSTRGVGSVEPYRGPIGEGYVQVKPGYQMKAIDIVFDPSAESFPNYFQEETDTKIYLGQTQSFQKVWEDIFGRK